MKHRLPPIPLPPPWPEPERFKVGVPSWIVFPGGLGFLITVFIIGWLIANT